MSMKSSQSSIANNTSALNSFVASLSQANDSLASSFASKSSFDFEDVISATASLYSNPASFSSTITSLRSANHSLRADNSYYSQLASNAKTDIPMDYGHTSNEPAVIGPDHANVVHLTKMCKSFYSDAKSESARADSLASDNTSLQSKADSYLDIRATRNTYNAMFGGVPSASSASQSAFSDTDASLSSAEARISKLQSDISLEHKADENKRSALYDSMMHKLDKKRDGQIATRYLSDISLHGLHDWKRYINILIDAKKYRREHND